MKPTALRWIAAISFVLALSVAAAARRPYYGGTLRIELRARIHSLDPKEPASDPVELAAKSLLNAAVSGPFNIARWEPGKGATLVANEEYSGGRPFLDSIEIQLGRDLKAQALDSSVGKADVTETGERRGKLTNTLAIVFESDRVSAGLREALSLAVDRATINTVLLKGQGEPSNALLPEWLSGYAFLFSKPRDVARARQLAAGGAPISFAYDRDDPVIRRIGERIGVNAMEAGIALRPAAAANADARLELLPMTMNDELGSLADIAVVLNLPFPSGANPYDAERTLLDGYKIIPVLHLGDAWAVSPRVHNWPDLANVWVNP